MQKASRKEIFGWAMFDFANQAYTLLIITVIFGDLFTRVIVGDVENHYRLGNLLWSLALSASYLLVVVTVPVFGAIMDFSGTRKHFLFASYLLTVIATAALYFVAPGYIFLGMLLIVISNYAYSMGESFISSFLPDLGRPEDFVKISGFGWALGGRSSCGAYQGCDRLIRASRTPPLMISVPPTMVPACGISPKKNTPRSVAKTSQQ
jgi:MFS transporter, UMF1 family